MNSPKHKTLFQALLDAIPAFVSLRPNGVQCPEVVAAFRSWDEGVDSQLIATVLRKLVYTPLKRRKKKKNTTKELADFAEACQELTRKEIAARWNAAHPHGKKVTPEVVRGAWRRYYGDKSISKKKRAKH